MLASRSGGQVGVGAAGRRAAQPEVGLHGAGPVDQLACRAPELRDRRRLDRLARRRPAGQRAAATSVGGRAGSRSPTRTRLLPAGSTRSRCSVRSAAAVDRGDQVGRRAAGWRRGGRRSGGRPARVRAMTPGCDRAMRDPLGDPVALALDLVGGVGRRGQQLGEQRPAPGPARRAASSWRTAAGRGRRTPSSSRAVACSSSAMPVWSCAAVPSSTAPESTRAARRCARPRPAPSARRTAPAAAARSAGRRGAGTTTSRSPLGSVVSCASGTGCGRGSPSGGISDRSSVGAHRRPPRGAQLQDGGGVRDPARGPRPHLLGR